MTRCCLCGGILGVALGFGWQVVTSRKEGPVTILSEADHRLELAREASLLDSDSSWNAQLLRNEASNVSKLYALAELDTNADQLMARLASLEEIANPDLRNSARRALLEPLIENDPQGAFEQCLALNGGDLRRTVLLEIAEGWGRASHEEALDFLSKQKGDSLRDELLLSVILGYGKDSPGKAITLAIDNSVNDRSYRLIDLFKEYARTEPERALQAAQVLDDDSLSYVTMKAWASSEPDGLMRYLADSEVDLDSSTRRNAYRELGKGWVERDPKGAADWVLTLTEEDLSKRDLRYVVRETAQTLAKTQPELAMALIENADLNADDYESVYASYGEWDWEGALESLHGLEGKRQRGAMRGLLENLEDRSKKVILAHLPTLRPPDIGCDGRCGFERN